MRFFRMAVLAGALTVLAGGAGAQMAVLFDWQGMGRSDVATVDKKVGAWRAAWECEPRSTVKISVMNASGVTFDFLGAAYKGERLFTRQGKFQFDTGGNFCKITITTVGELPAGALPPNT